MDRAQGSPFRVEVIADSSGTWCGNALQFETSERAQVWAEDLYARWTAVRTWRVVDADGAVVALMARAA